MANSVGRIKLGSNGLEVSVQGLGCMGMSAAYGQPKPDEDMIELIHHAVNSGVTFLDTSDIYGPHTNEILIGKALKGGWREKVQLATKFGSVYEDGNYSIRGDPQFVRAACEGSLKRLDVDYIDLYYQHRIDTNIPVEITMRELKKPVEEGKIKYIGLSEASASTIRRAHAVHPVTAVQLEWSLWTRDVEEDIIPTCRIVNFLSQLMRERSHINSTMFFHQWQSNICIPTNWSISGRVHLNIFTKQNDSISGKSMVLRGLYTSVYQYYFRNKR